MKRLTAPTDVVIYPDGKMLLAVGGGSERCFFGTGGVVPLMPDGALDSTFSNDGVAFRTCTLVRRVALADEGRILVGGSIFAGGGSGEFYPTLSRLDPTGHRDVSFGVEGTEIFPPEEGYWSGTRGLLLQNDGKIVIVAGGVYDPGLAVGRFLSA